MRRIYQAVILTATSLMAATIIACDRKESAPLGDLPVTVTTEEVRAVASTDKFTVSGNIEGMKTVRLAFQVAGRIAGVNGEEGSMVSKGKPIAWLDPANYAIAKEMADVQVAQATDEYRRISILHERNSVSESDYMKCKYALDAAVSQQKLRAKDLADTKLYAPINGMLLQKIGEEGEMTSAGMPVLVVSDISKVKVNAYIPESRLKDISIGQDVMIRIDAVGAVRQGKVSEVGGMADPAARAFTVKTIVDNPGYAIRPGMIAEATFDVKGNMTAISISCSALLRTPDGQPYVYVADKGRRKAFRRNVSIGAVRGNRIEVSSGLKAGETVVIGGAQKL